MTNTPQEDEELRMTDKEFVDVLRAKLQLINHTDSVDEGDIAIENALDHIWSTMTRNSWVKAHSEKVALQRELKLIKDLHSSGCISDIDGEHWSSEIQSQLNNLSVCDCIHGDGACEQH